MPSAALVETVDQLDPAAYAGTGYRHQAAHWDPLSGAGARSRGGRWNPSESFATLYLATESEVATAEFHRMAQRAKREPWDFLPRRLFRYELRLEGLVDLRTEDARAGLGLSDADLYGDDLGACQAIGEAAQYLGREGIVAPSAARAGTVIAVFLDSLEPSSSVEAVDYETWDTPP